MHIVRQTLSRQHWKETCKNLEDMRAAGQADFSTLLVLTWWSNFVRIDTSLIKISIYMIIEQNLTGKSWVNCWIKKKVTVQQLLQRILNIKLYKSVNSQFSDAINISIDFFLISYLQNCHFIKLKKKKKKGSIVILLQVLNSRIGLFKWAPFGDVINELFIHAGIWTGRNANNEMLIPRSNRSDTTFTFSMKR